MTTWDERAPLIPNDPPKWFVPALGWLMIAMFATAVLAAIFVRVPETVNAPFVLEPERGADPIQAPRNAVIEQVLLRAGQRVKKGEVLFLMRVDQVREWRTENDSRQETLRSLRERIGKQEEAYSAAAHIKDAEIDQAQREVAFREEHLRIMRDLVARAEKLQSTGLISEIELSSHRLDAAQSEKDLQVARKTLAQRHLERQRLDVDRNEERIRAKSEASELSIRIAALQQPLAASANGLLEIRAPYDAICVRVTQETPGRVVTAGEPLCQLTPVNGRLQARLALPESGVPRLRPRQPVRFLLDAFPYQRFGVATGQVEWISPAAVEQAGQQSDFVALASVDRPSIVAGTNVYSLKPGMRGQARVTVGRRAIIEYAFEPLRKIRENL